MFVLCICTRYMYQTGLLKILSVWFKFLDSHVNFYDTTIISHELSPLTCVCILYMYELVMHFIMHAYICMYNNIAHIH